MDDEIQVRRSSTPQRVKKKPVKKYPTGRWVMIYEDTEFETWVRTLENLPEGRVQCELRGGARLIVPRSVLPSPAVTRKRPRR